MLGGPFFFDDPASRQKRRAALWGRAMSDPAVLRHVIESIGAGVARRTPRPRAQRVAGAGAPMLERLAAALGGAQHTPRPRARSAG